MVLDFEILWATLWPIFDKLKAIPLGFNSISCINETQCVQKHYVLYS